MPKPICVKCQRFFRPLKNDIRVLEGKPIVDGAQPGTFEPNSWAPYKVWHADLWHCKGCGTQIIVGFGQRPAMEDYKDDPEKMKAEATHRVNDC